MSLRPEKCETCRYEVEVRKHPWNRRIKSAKGSITEGMGYVCTAMQHEGFVVFFDSRGIGCELHTELEDSHVPA